MKEITLFAGVQKRKGLFSWKGLFLFDVAPTIEIEWPYRKCKHSLLIHFWPGKALTIGRWSWSGLSEQEALIAATEGYRIGDWKPESSAGD
jgi:hypothetical protein